jgi:hypothetical protein
MICAIKKSKSHGNRALAAPQIKFLVVSFKPYLTLMFFSIWNAQDWWEQSGLIALAILSPGQ